MQQGSGYPGMWQLSNVTRWVNREASSVGRREALTAPKRRERRGSSGYIVELSSPQPHLLGATNVSLAMGDLVSEHLDDHLRLNPHAGLYVALDARRLPLTDVRFAALSHLAPLDVAQAGTDFGDGREDVALRVVGSNEECAHAERGPPTPAVDVADDDAVNSVLE